MRTRLLHLSIGLNLVLVLAASWAMRSHSPAPATAPPVATAIPQIVQEVESNAVLAPAASVVASPPASLLWSELESEDYPTYVAHLRKAGCPEEVLRRIIGAELRELYAKKAFALVQEFHRDFWTIAAHENVGDYFDKTLSQQVKALCEQPDALLKELVGGAPAEVAKSSESNSTSKGKSRDETETSGDVNALQQLAGVDFTETELNKVAGVLQDYQRRADSHDEPDPETLDEKLRRVLGPERFADFNRARSASYQELYEVVSDFGQPAETAAQVFDLRLKAEKQSDEIRASRTSSNEEKQALLDELEEQVEQTVRTKLGAAAYQTYQNSGGRWINALGRI